MDPSSSSPTTGTGSSEVAPSSAPKTSRFDRRIVEGSIPSALWTLAWPTLVQNVVGGIQGLVDHAMVGRYVDYTGNAAIGVSWQIFLVVVVFISSLYSGMGVLVARFAGAGDEEKVNRTVYQAFLVSLILGVGILAPLGYFLTPYLLNLVNAAPEVQQEAAPYLRVLFLYSFGLLTFFMLGGALRSAGDARTPLRLGLVLTILNLVLNVILIRGLGPIPSFGTTGAAMGTVIATGVVSLWGLYLLTRGKLVVHLTRAVGLKPDWAIIASLFRFGLPTGFQAVAMNLGGVLLLHFIGSLTLSAEAQAAYAVGYGQIFSLITWTGIALMTATATVAGQSLGAELPERAAQVPRISSAMAVTATLPLALFFAFCPRLVLGLFGLDDPEVLTLGSQLLRYLVISAALLPTALCFTGALQGTGDTRSPMWITLFSQLLVPVGWCFVLGQIRDLQPVDIWVAILLGHLIRCTLSVARFQQGQWRDIEVGIGKSPRRT
ncbi:MAG: MATE family efflux transporter [Acidobacteriota bacterium]